MKAESQCGDDDMGMFKQKVRVSNTELFFEEEFWIDTGDPINKMLKPILGVIGGFRASSVERSVLGACQGPVVSKDGGLKGN
jgi:hypothetical protein